MKLTASPSYAEVKDLWSYIPSYFFMAWCFIKYWDGFTVLTFAYSIVLPSKLTSSMHSLVPTHRVVCV